MTLPLWLAYLGRCVQQFVRHQLPWIVLIGSVLLLCGPWQSGATVFVAGLMISIVAAMLGMIVVRGWDRRDTLEQAFTAANQSERAAQIRLEEATLQRNAHHESMYQQMAATWQQARSEIQDSQTQFAELLERKDAAEQDWQLRWNELERERNELSGQLSASKLSEASTAAALEAQREANDARFSELQETKAREESRLNEALSQLQDDNRGLEQTITALKTELSEVQASSDTRAHHDANRIEELLRERSQQAQVVERTEKDWQCKLDEAQQRFDELTQQSIDLKSQLAESHAAAEAQAKADLERLGEAQFTLAEQRDRFEKTQADWQEKLDEKDQSVIAANQALAELNATVNLRVQNERDRAEELQSQFVADKQQLTSQLDALREEIQQHKTHIAELTASAATQHNAHVERLQEIVHEKNALHSELQGKQSHIEHLQEEHRGRCHELEAEIERLQHVTSHSEQHANQQTETLRLQLEQLEEASRQQLQELEASLREAHQQNEALRLELAETRSAADARAEEDHAQIERLHNDLTTCSTGQSAAFESTLHAKATAEARAAQLEDELAKLRSDFESKLAHQFSERDTLQELLDETAQQVDTLRQELEVAQFTTSEVSDEQLQHMQHELESKADAWQQERDAMATQLAQQEKLIQQLQESSEMNSSEQLGRMHELQAAVRRMKGEQTCLTELIESLAGDFRDQIRTISLATANRTDAKVATNRKLSLEHAASAVNDVGNLLDSVVDVINHAENPPELKHAVFDVREMVSGLAKQTRSREEKDAIEVSEAVSDSIPVLLRGDRDRIRSAMWFAVHQLIESDRSKLGIHVMPVHDVSEDVCDADADNENTAPIANLNSPEFKQFRFVISAAGETLPDIDWNTDRTDRCLERLDEQFGRATMLVIGRLAEILNGKFGIHLTPAGEPILFFELPCQEYYGSEADQRIHARMNLEHISCSVGQILDLSLGGMRVKCTSVPEPLVDFSIEHGDEKIDLRAEVVWNKRVGFRKHEVGLRFLNVSREVNDRLADLAMAHVKRVGLAADAA